MTNLMKPVIVDEIEFYVSNDGTEVGVSISGLARLCGITQQAISNVLKEVESDTTKSRLKTLQLLPDKLFSIQPAENNAKVINGIVATRLIKYYAYESKYSNKTAKYSLDKFLELGFNNWVKAVTGFENVSVNNDDLISKLYFEFIELKEETKELRKLKAKTTTSYLGLDKLITDLIKEEDDLLPPNNTSVLKRKYTLTEWLREEKGILDISPSFRSRLAIMVSQNYKTLKNNDPEKESRKHKDGRINNGVQVYAIEDLPILEWSFNRVFQKI